ncbi:hypothetical protein PLEOSDRAFT_1085228 [Pleurotus ostreatus PC15]|uniref:Uncharacterized protein n=1 Tax=Pleurotus ostreatus (strain PC15) TaxID=1137138 RepID=A0A067NFZ2_PLEO1|nr:hypothetical protein PLEOSDRAFT_1085228 [Pleurotus ostreatus PC15]
MATTQSDTESTYTAITYIGCRGPIALSKTTFKVFKSRCPVRAIVFIEGFEDAGYPIDSLHKAIAKRDTEATPKPSTNCFANLGKKKKAKSMANPPMIFFSEPTTNVEIRLYVTDKDEEKLLAQTKVPLSCLDGDVKVSWTSPELLGSLKEDPVMTFKRTTHSEFDSKLTSIGDLPPINSIFLATFANLKRFIGVGKALSELTTPAGKVIIGLVEAIALECDGYVKRRESVTGLLQTVGDACMLVADWDNRKLYQHRPNQTKVYQYVFPAVYRCLYFVASLSPTKIAANLHDLEGEIKKLQGQLGTIMQRLEHNRDLDMQEMLCDILHIVTKIERISLDDEQWLTVKDIHIFVHEKLGKWPDVAHLVNRVTDVAEGLFQCAALLCAELTGPQVLEAYIDPQNELRLKAFKHLMASIFLVRSPQHRNALLPLAAATLSRERQSASEPCGQWSALQSGEERSALVSILPLLGSLLSGSTFDANEVAVLPLHTSFRDFLVEPVKVPKGPDFSVDIGPRHQELLALACLDITNAQLRFNMCGFDTSYALNSEIDGFQERAKKLDPELKYACQCAAYHLDKSLGQLDELLHEKLARWARRDAAMLPEVGIITLAWRARLNPSGLHQI